MLPIKILTFLTFAAGMSLYPMTSQKLSFPEYKIKKIMIDPGHGGRDTGCSGVKAIEKEITLSIAQAVGKMINDSLPGVEVVYTRTHDEFLRPGARADIANCSGADLLISVHCNSLPRYPNVRGTETYVMRYANKKYLKVDESKSDVGELVETHYTQNSDAVDMTNNFLTELDRYPNLYQSVILAGLVEKFFKTQTPLKSRGVRQENYSVLRDTYMPSVLVEMGFLSNRDDEAYINSNEGKAEISTAIYNAFKEYKKTIEGKRIMK
jgi:N-acetylmuramoyl-L-alanine amidase